MDDFFDDDDLCGACGACGGTGGYHDCGEDCCCCLDPEEITHYCDICGGTGEFVRVEP